MSKIMKKLIMNPWTIRIGGGVVLLIIGSMFFSQEKKATQIVSLDQTSAPTEVNTNSQISNAHNITKTVDNSIYQNMENSPGGTQVAGNYYNIGSLNVRNEKNYRKIPSNLKDQIVSGLKNLEPKNIKIRAISGDEETISLSDQLKDIFESVSWKVNREYRWITAQTEPFLVYSDRDPGFEFRKAIAPIFNSLGYDPVVSKAEDVPPNTVWFEIGTNK